MKTRKMTLTAVDMSILDVVLGMPGLGVKDFHKAGKLLDLVEDHIEAAKQAEFKDLTFDLEMEVPVANWTMRKVQECCGVRMSLAREVLTLINTLAGREKDEEQEEAEEE